jgi:hypothetical protein
MKVLAVTVALALLSGCAHWFGPAHGTFDAVGSTPGDAPCQLSLAPVGSSSAASEWSVSGHFRQRILISPSRRGHRIALSCNGILTAERTFKYGRDVGARGELAVDGSVR